MKPSVMRVWSAKKVETWYLKIKGFSLGVMTTVSFYYTTTAAAVWLINYTRAVQTSNPCKPQLINLFLMITQLIKFSGVPLALICGVGQLSQFKKYQFMAKC